MQLIEWRTVGDSRDCLVEIAMFQSQNIELLPDVV